ncbi:hypothetical protein RND71_036190 [Anisodus tanguticus]|uniref:Calcium-transporting ATPase n=1 Tax=Anisodus tanguticus TaxID=243964 RepID=A0AAE1V259_9SOLA|nr:hypothetical protein RND71_036190 [Anisodus tanguticus]
MVCAVVSIGVGLATEGWPKGTYDGLGILLGIFLVVIVTAISDYKQSLQFRDLDKEKKNIFIQVTRDGSRHKVSVYNLVIGDLVHLSIGDLVPTDEIFVSGYSLLIDQSSLSDRTGVCSADVYGVDCQISGSESTSPRAHEMVFWRFTDSTKLLCDSCNYNCCCGSGRTASGSDIESCICNEKLMDNKALVRHLSACETMGSATCICTDKTGTLTTNRMVVDKIWICEKIKKVEADICGDAITLNISENALAFLLQAIFHNTGAKVVKDKDGKKSILGTPTESAILKYGMLLGGNMYEQRKDCKLLKVEPFNSEKKKMSVLIALPDGKIRAFCEGAVEIIFKMCDMFIDLNSEIVHLTDNRTRNIMDVINEFTGEALRTLCLAYKDIEDGYEKNSIPDSGYTLVAVVGIKDPVRPGTAKAIAKECGILTADGLAIEGPEFRNKTPDEMRHIIPRIQVIARSLPMDKLVLINNLRGMFKEIVVVTGDGTNDAPALHEADIGFAMGIAGTEVAKESADIIVLDDNFSTIVSMAKWGRSVYSMFYQRSTHFTAAQLLWGNLIMDTLGAIALATEPPHEGLMSRPPVGREVFNEINCRDMEKINVFHGIFGSWIFLGVIISTVVFQVVIVEFLGTFASTTPLSLELWLLSVLIGTASLIVAVILKLITIEQRNTKHYDGYDLLPNGPELA